MRLERPKPFLLLLTSREDEGFVAQKHAKLVRLAPVFLSHISMTTMTTMTITNGCGHGLFCHHDFTRWARWLITWQLELEDGKTRPRGSPPRDTSLAALFGGSGAAAAARAVSPATHGEHQAAAGGSTCTFPEHTPDCR